MAYLVGENGSLSVCLKDDVGGVQEVIQVQSLSWTGIEQPVVDAYGIDSPARTTRPSNLPELGTIEVEFAFDPGNTTHALLEASSINAAELDYSFSIPTATPTVYTGECYVTSFEYSGIEIDGTITASVSLKVNTKA